MKARITSAVSLLVVASLALSACGASVKQTLRSALDSVGAQSTVQMHLTASVSATGAGASSVATYQSILAKLSYDVHEQSANGDAIADAAGKVNSDITVNVSGTPLVHLIEINNTIYVKIDFTALSAFPQIGSSLSSQLPAAQLTFGNRWFEVPSSLVLSYLSASQKSTADSAGQSATETKLLDAVVKVIESNPYTATSNGFEQTGTLDSLAAGLAPAIAALEHQKATTVGHTPGTYHVALGLDGSVATSGTIGITAPNGGSDMSVSLTATISHNDIAVTAPANATVITPALLKSLGAGGL